MKTNTMIYRIFKVMSLLAMTLVLANCGKSDNGGGSSNYNSGYVVTNGQCYLNGAVQTALSACQSAATTYYGYVGSMCYQVGQGAYTNVQTTYCTNNGSSAYQMINGQCYSTVNGYQQVVNYSLCQNSGYNNGYGQQLCNGYFTDGRTVAMCTEGVSGYSYQNGGQTPFGYGSQVIVMDCSGYTLYNANWQVVTCQ